MACVVLSVAFGQEIESPTTPPTVPVVPAANDESLLTFVSTVDNAPVGDGAIGAFGIWDLVRMVVALIVVVAAVYGVVAVLRRRVESGEESVGPIRVLASQSLAGNRSVHALRVGPRVYLVGVSDAAVNLIAGIRDQETIDELELAHSASRAATRRRSFGAILGQWVSQAAAAGLTGGSGGGTSPLGSLRQQRERLRGMR